MYIEFQEERLQLKGKNHSPLYRVVNHIKMAIQQEIDKGYFLFLIFSPNSIL
jgi:hypothetical protein